MNSCFVHARSSSGSPLPPFQTNTFQCILVTDGVQSYAVFQYADGLIQWTTGDDSGGLGGLGGTQAQVGFNAGDSENYQNVPGSRTLSIINITSTSNVLVPGQWIFEIHSNITTSTGNAISFKSFVTCTLPTCHSSIPTTEPVAEFSLWLTKPTLCHVVCT